MATVILFNFTSKLPSVFFLSIVVFRLQAESFRSQEGCYGLRPLESEESNFSSWVLVVAICLSGHCCSWILMMTTLEAALLYYWKRSFTENCLINIDRINVKSQMLIETRAEQLINIGCAIVLKIGRWRPKKIEGKKKKKSELKTRDKKEVKSEYKAQNRCSSSLT